MKYINKTTKQLFAPYHLLSVYPELRGVEITKEVLETLNLDVLQTDPFPVAQPWQQVIEGPVVGVTQTWSVIDLPLDVVKENKTTEINSWRDGENLSPVLYQGELFDADPESQFRVLAVVIMGSGSPTGYWTSADNKDIPADAAFMQGLYTAMITRVATVHHRQRVMKTEVAALTTPQAVYEYKVGAA